MPYKDVNGLRIHYMTQGDPSRPKVVLLHGLLTGSVASWCFGLGRLLAEDFHVVMYDQRGHGLSDQPETGYRLVQFCHDLEVMCPGDEPLLLIGHSFGGIVALAYAKERPDRVAKVLTIDTFISGIGESAREIVEQGQQPVALGEESPSPGGQQANNGPDPDVVPRRWGTPASRPRSRLSKEETLLSKTTILEDLDEYGDVAEEAVQSIGVPVLATVGTRSPFRLQAMALAKLLPQAEIIELEGGHGLHVDAKEDLARLAASFFSSPKKGQNA